MLGFEPRSLVSEATALPPRPNHGSNLNIFIYIPVSGSSSTSVIIPTHQSGSGEQSEDTEQFGGGSLPGTSSLLSEPTLEKIASIVVKKLGKNVPSTSSWRTYERSEPTVAVTVPENTNPPIAYDHKIVKTDLNDQKDTEKVLRKVPRKHLSNAIRLLESFEERSDELTYDCTGTIYIDQESIPNSNIFELMPYLFKKQSTKLPGFQDFVHKIVEMGLEHLIAYRPKEVRLISNTASQSTKNPKSNTPWWYLGP